MCEKVAKAGSGTASIIKDNEYELLKGKVINALRKATEPSLKDCSFEIGDKKFELGDIFRN